MNKFRFSLLILISIFSSNIVFNCSLLGAKNTASTSVSVDYKTKTKESFKKLKDKIKILLVDMKKAVPEIGAKLGKSSEVAFKSMIQFLEFLYQNILIKGGKLTLKGLSVGGKLTINGLSEGGKLTAKGVKLSGMFMFKLLSMVGFGLKKGLLGVIDFSKAGLGVAGAGLDVAKKMAEFMKVICEIIWINLNGARRSMLSVVKVGASLTVATIFCFGFMAWWFGFNGVLINIKEIIKLVGHPLITRFINAFSRLMTFANKGLDRVCNISFDSNDLKHKFLRWTIGWWYKPVFCALKENISTDVLSEGTSVPDDTPISISSPANRISSAFKWMSCFWKYGLAPLSEDNKSVTFNVDVF